ncbi:unnamed protein product [Peniophora sp. CBMAI 1063]|nr:unnamed protein product [Peniophora sp. CBMAI 1063]
MPEPVSSPNNTTRSAPLPKPCYYCQEEAGPCAVAAHNHIPPVSEGKVQVESLGEWVPSTHAEGSLYFFHSGRRIWTNAYMYEAFYHEEVEACAAYLEYCHDVFTDEGFSLPADYELVIDIGPSKFDDNDLYWNYYYVDHATRTIFWLQHYILWRELDAVTSELSADHLAHKFRQFYWRHVFYFPEGRRNLCTYFGEDVWSQLLSFMHFTALDTILSSRSTSVYSDTELGQMRKMVKLARDQSRENTLLSEQLSAVARIQMFFAEQRFLYAHGQLHVRLKNNVRTHPDEAGRKQKSWLFSAIGLALFRAPLTLLEDLHDITGDSMMQDDAWRKYFKQLLADWDRLVLQGTVILTANVSFLAIPDVIHFPGQPSGDGPNSAIQPWDWVRPQFTWSGLLSYISTLLALGSVMAGLFLARLNRSQTEHYTDTTDTGEYMYRHTSSLFGLEPIAIIYSLPYALLIWGTGFFLAALLSFTFDSTDTATRSVVGAGAMALALDQEIQCIRMDRGHKWLLCISSRFKRATMTKVRKTTEQDHEGSRREADSLGV